MKLRSSLVSLVLLSLASACSSAQPPAAAPPAAGKAVDAATAGAVAGRVTFTGPPPVRETLKVGVDAACVKHAGPNPQSDAVLVTDGALQNAFVYVKAGLDPAYTFDIPTDAVLLNQEGCIYTPRVVGLRAGQPIEVMNSDPTLHNVHALPKVNREFNFAQIVQGRRDRRTFTAPEVMVRFMCNVHGWMAAYVGVLPHPYFAVTDASGAFEIKGVPPGTYTIEAWHETLGVRTASVTIADRQSQTVSFAFAPKTN
jgi:plastocyanin